MEQRAALTDDAVLGGRLRLLQPSAGYRVAIDPILLAAAAPARAGQRVLDAGCGVGAAGLCLAARVPGCTVVGLELQPELAALARDNAVRNGLAERVGVTEGDLCRPPSGLGGFDLVLTNPPYHPATADPSPDPGKAVANIEAVPLAAWVGACLALLRPKGTLVIIHRADRLPELFAALHGRAGAVRVLPLWPKAGRPAKRVILRARKGSAAAAALLPGLALHQPEGAFTAAADAILRGGSAEPLFL